jgi:hypothetical protein
MLIAGRIIGWTLIALSLLMASGDAVLALGTGEHSGIVAGTLWTLVTGKTPETVVPTESIATMLLAWPAWAAIGPIGIMLVATCRPRRPRRLRFRRI